MRVRRARRMTLARGGWAAVMLIAAACIGALPEPSWGDRDVIVQNGDQIESLLADGADGDIFRIRTSPGARLEVRARVRDGEIPLTVVLRTEDDPAVLERGEGRSVRVRTRTEDAQTIVAEVSAANDGAVEPIRYDVTFRWQVDRRRRHRLDFRMEPETGPVPRAFFHGGAGETVRLYVRSPRGHGRVLHWIDTSFGPVATDLRTRVHELTLPYSAWYSVSVLPERAVSIVTVKRRRARRQIDLSNATIRPADGGAILGVIGGEVSTVLGASGSWRESDRVVLTVPLGDGNDRRPITLSDAPDLVQPEPGIDEQYSAIRIGPDELAASPEAVYELTVPTSYQTDRGWPTNPRVFVQNIDGTVEEVPPSRIQHRTSERLLTISHAGPGTFQVFGKREPREGVSVAATDEWIAVGLPGATVDGYVNAGVVEVYRRGASGWEVETVLRLVAPQDEDEFGFTVAASDDTLVVNSPGVSFLASPAHAGFVYERSESGEWSLTDELVATTETLKQSNGYVSLTASGDVVAAGGFFEPAATNGQWVPVVLVFERTNGQWELTHRIVRDSNGPRFFFGHFLASTDGLIVIGTMGASDPPFVESGAAVFRRDGATGEWAFDALLSPPASASGCGTRSLDDYHPASVAVDGDTIALGLMEGGDYGLYENGAVCLFRREIGLWNVNTVIQPEHRLEDPLTPCPRIGFGSSVSLAGNRILVGAPELQSIDGPIWGGGAYLYHLNGDSAQLEAVFETMPHAPNSELGRQVVLLPSGDGAVVAGLSEIDPDDPRSIGRVLAIDLD